MDTKKILLADPSEPVRKVIVNAFEDEDFELIIADDFDSAIKKVNTEAPSLILAGISLPGKDGYALCEYIKGIDPLIPVVMLVGIDETLNSEEALRVGADDYFIRPFKSQDLIEKISDLLATFARGALSVAEDRHTPAEPLLTQPVVSDFNEPALVDVDEPALVDVDEVVTPQEPEPASYGELSSLATAVETSEPEEHEVDIALEGLESTDINESSDAFLAEMGLEEDEDLDIVFGNADTREESGLDSLEGGEEEEDSIMEEILSDIDIAEEVEILSDVDLAEAVETLTDDIPLYETNEEEQLINEIETNEAVVEELNVQVDQTNEVIADEVIADEVATEEISFNDDAVIEEPKVEREIPGVVASVDEKGVAVEGIVEISKSKIEELIINNTREEIKNIAYELVPGLAKDPISKIVPEASRKAAERLVGEIVKETTAQVAEGIIKEIAAEITSRKAVEHIAKIVGEAVTKAAEERIREIANEAAMKAANEIISGIAEKTAIDVAERLIIGEIKSFKTKLSKEG